MNCDPNALMESAKCFRCIPAGEQSAIQIYLLCQWANVPTGCGVPSLNIQLSGAGDAVNGRYTFVDATNWASVPPIDIRYRIVFNGTVWQITFLGFPQYEAVLFPCTWISVGGLNPPPTGQYVTFTQPIWTPDTEVANWIDAGGAHAGDLATFLSTADFGTTTSLVFGATGALTSLDGLASLPFLTTLDCNTNIIPSLNVTGLTSLVTLNCSANAIGTLTGIGTCTALTTLNCSGNASLTSLSGITTLAALVTLDCKSCDITGTLDLSGLANLNTADCGGNINVTALNVTGCTSMANLLCNDLSIASLDVTTCTSIADLRCNSNALLTSLNITGCNLLSYLDINSTAIVTIDASTCSGLVDFICDFCSSLTSVDVSSTSIVHLQVQNGTGSIDTLIVTNCLSMDFIECYNNVITSLDVSTCSAITDLDCHNNDLTTLNVTGCSNLLYCICYGNSGLGALDVSTCTSLVEVDAHGNSLASLDLSLCTAMQILDCSSQYSLGSPVLSDLRIGDSTNYTQVLANDNALPAAPNGVDQTLNKLAANCLANAGVCDVDTAATNASPTGGILNADYVALTGAGWTVNIN